LLAIFWAVSPHLLSQNDKIWRNGANLGDSPPRPILAKLYKKITILAILTPVSPHFQSHNREVWREATDLGHLSMPNFVKIAQGPAGIALSRKGDAY